MTTATAAPPSEVAVASPRRFHPATAVLGALMLAAGLLLLYATRHLTFFFDEWDFILHRRGSGASTYLAPHNGHLLVFSVVVYKVLFAIVGLRHYTPYVLVLIALHLLCAALLYVLARRRVGPWPALVPTVLLLFLGAAYQDLLWPFQISLLASVAGGLAALALLERDERRADMLAAVMLVWSLGGSAVGIPFLVACAVELIAQRSPWRRLWVVAAPALLFAVWYLGWGGGQHITADSVLAAPQYIAEAAGGASAAIFGLGTSWGTPLAVGGLIALGLAWSRQLDRAPAPLALAAAAGALAFWGLSAVERADVAEPAASRYLYIGAVFIFLMAVASIWRVRPRPVPIALGVLLLVGALVANVGALRTGERGLRASDSSVRASLRVIEVAAPVVSPAFQPEPANAPQITAGRYLAAVRDLGSPALTLPELERAPESIRSRSDILLERVEALAVTPAATIAGARPLAVTGATGGRVIPRGTCQDLLPAASTASLEIRVPSGAVLLVRTVRGSTAQVFLRRFASSFDPQPFATIAGDAAIRFPADRAPPVPWQVELTAARPLDVCLS